MADIGSLLRETRIRNKIDITTVEEATKIRAKYLRALENEEWILLPGPTYVKTFLRTYAQFLGLDPHLLVEEYSARFEEPEELEVAAFTPKRRLPERTAAWALRTRGIAVALLVLGFLGFLLVLGLTSDEEPSGGRAQERTPTERDRPAAAGRPSAPRRSRTRRLRGASGCGSRWSRRGRCGCAWSTAPIASAWAASCSPPATGRGPSAHARSGLRSATAAAICGSTGAGATLRIAREPLGYRVRPSGVTVLSQERSPTCG